MYKVKATWLSLPNELLSQQIFIECALLYKTLRPTTAKLGFISVLL